MIGKVINYWPIRRIISYWPIMIGVVVGFFLSHFLFPDLSWLTWPISTSLCWLCSSFCGSVWTSTSTSGGSGSSSR